MLFDLDEVCQFINGDTSGTDETISDWIHETIPEETVINNENELKDLCRKAIDGVVNVIKTSPSVDPETLPLVQELREKLEECKPVRHAHWKQAYRSGLPVPLGNGVCSDCDCFNSRKSNYCPNCGAIMDDGK